MFGGLIKMHYICTKLFNLFIINIKTFNDMRKITLLLATMFAFVSSSFAAVPTNDTFGYLTNKASGKSVNASAKVADEGVIFKITDMKDCGASFGSDDGTIEEAGYTYARFLLRGTGDYMRVTKSGVSCSGSGYHKWAIMDTDKGLVLRCIYTSTQRNGDLDPFAQQGYYLTAAEDGSLTLEETPIEASYWFFDSEKVEKEIAAAEEAEIKATQDALAALNDGAGLKVGDEITVLLKNPNFTDGGTGWTVNNGKIEKKGSNDNPVITAYNYTFDVSQTIKGLPTGWYKIKAQAFSRPTTNQGSLDLIAAGTELENNCVIYGNDVQKYVKQLTDEHLTSAGAGTWSSHEVGGETIYLPNNGSAFSDAFTRGMYENELDCSVGDDGVLTLGVKNTKSPSGQGETYCGYDNFRLFYLGDNPTTAIATVKEKTAQKAIYNLAGQKVSAPVKGLNIIDGKKVYIK